MYVLCLCYGLAILCDNLIYSSIQHEESNFSRAQEGWDGRMRAATHSDFAAELRQIAGELECKDQRCEKAAVG